MSETDPEKVEVMSLDEISGEEMGALSERVSAEAALREPTLGEMEGAADGQARADLTALLAAAGWTGVMPTSVEFFGGVAPFVGWGRAGQWAWYFRFRGDNATLRVGKFVQAHEGYVRDECVVWAAERRDTTGDPYGGSLSHEQMVKLLAQLWLNLSVGEE